MAAAALAGTPGLDGSAPRGQTRAGLRQQAVEVAVVGAGELQHPLASGGGASQPQGGHRGLRPRGGHAQHLHALHPPGDLGRERHLGGRGGAEAGPACGRRGERVQHLGVGVAEDQRPPRADVVDVAVPVDVDELGALAPLDEDRVAPDRAIARTGELTPPGSSSRARR